MQPAAVLDRIAAAYGLSGARLQARLRNSRENEAFRMACANGPMVLRRLRARDGLERVLEQHVFMIYLAGRGFPVPGPLSTTERETVARVGEAAYAVYPLVRGRTFQRGSVRDAAAAAAALARFHGLSAEYNETMVSAEPAFRKGFLASAGRFPGLAEDVSGMSSTLRIARKLEYMRKSLPAIEAAIVRLRYDDLPQVTIHGDYRRANLLFSDGELAAVLDFDRSRREARVLDVAIAVSNLCRGAYKKVFLDLDLVRAFMDAYRQTLPLEDRELTALPVLIKARVAAAVLDRIERLRDAPVEERRKRAHKFRKYAKRLRWLETTSGEWEEALARSGRDAR